MRVTLSVEVNGEDYDVRLSGSDTTGLGGAITVENIRQVAALVDLAGKKALAALRLVA